MGLEPESAQDGASGVDASGEVDDELDAAYRAKYRRYAKSTTDAINSPAARSTTLRLLPSQLLGACSEATLVCHGPVISWPNASPSHGLRPPARSFPRAIWVHCPVRP